jgi:hypothetical protein
VLNCITLIGLTYLKEEKKFTKHCIHYLSQKNKERKGLKQFRDETISLREEQPTFTEDTAKKSNLTQRQIQNYIRIAESLPEDVKEVVKEVDLPMNEAFVHYKPK